MRVTNRFLDQRGFTMAELLVVSAVIGIVMAGLLALVMSGQQAYLYGTSQVDAQQNARVAIERLAKEIREAGYYPQPPTCPTAGAGNPCTPATFAYNFDAVTGQTATAMTLQYDWNGDAAATLGATVTDPLTGAQRGEVVTWSFAGGNLSRQETGIDNAPVVVASGITGLAFTYLDANDVVTGTPAAIRTATITMTAAPAAGGAFVNMVHRIRLRNR